MPIDELRTLTILRVARAELTKSARRGQWPCARCGTGYAVHDGWLIDYYNAPTRETARAYVCPTCASEALGYLTEAEDTG